MTTMDETEQDRILSLNHAFNEGISAACEVLTRQAGLATHTPVKNALERAEDAVRGLKRLHEPQQTVSPETFRKVWMGAKI